jgi:S1-C subfamily serine protease
MALGGTGRGGMKWTMMGLLCLAATGCGGDSAPIISERDATGGECTAGGTVLLVDGKTAALVCNGANGRDGAPGAPGIQGEPGSDGADGEVGVAGPAGAAGKNAASPPNIVAEVAAKAAAIVIVECTDGDKTGDGSGTKTDRGTVITAMHVVDDMTSCNVFSQAPVAFLGSMTRATQRGTRDQVELSMDWTADAALIPGLTPTLRVVPAIGDLVTVVGHPGVYDGLSLEHQYTTGFVTATDLSATLATVPTLVNAGLTTRWAQGWSTDAVAWHGNSGGPVFDATGNWIGLLVGAFNGSSDNEGPDLSVVLPLR